MGLPTRYLFDGEPDQPPRACLRIGDPRKLVDLYGDAAVDRALDAEQANLLFSLTSVRRLHTRERLLPARSPVKQACLLAAACSRLDTQGKLETPRRDRPPVVVQLGDPVHRLVRLVGRRNFFDHVYWYRQTLLHGRTGPEAVRHLKAAACHTPWTRQLLVDAGGRATGLQDQCGHSRFCRWCWARRLFPAARWVAARAGEGRPLVAFRQQYALPPGRGRERINDPKHARIPREAADAAWEAVRQRLYKRGLSGWFICRPELDVHARPVLNVGTLTAGPLPDFGRALRGLEPLGDPEVRFSAAGVDPLTDLFAPWARWPFTANASPGCGWRLALNAALVGRRKAVYAVNVADEPYGPPKPA